MKMIRILHFFLLAGITVFSFCCKVGAPQSVVKSGPFRVSLVETGELLAVNSRVVVMPMFDWDYGEPKLTELAKEGITVKKGDVVGQLETAGVVRVQGQKEADLAIARADMNKLLVQQEFDRKKTNSELTSAEAALRMALIDTQRTRFESPSKMEISRLNLKMAEVELQNCKQNAETLLKIQKEQLLIQTEQINRILAEIQNAKDTIKLFTLRAPADGMIEYRRMRRSREKIRVGDDFRPGEPLIGLPDLSRMKVVTEINEKDIQKIRVGQQVWVRLDAYPKKSYEGAVSTIGIICREKEDKSRIKVFEVEILLKESSMALRPGMTVSCEIVVSELPEALFVDNNFIYQSGSEYFVQVARSSRIRPVAVKLGPRNNKFVVVSGDLKAGDRVVRPDASGVPS